MNLDLVDLMFLALGAACVNEARHLVCEWLDRRRYMREIAERGPLFVMKDGTVWTHDRRPR